MIAIAIIIPPLQTEEFRMDDRYRGSSSLLFKRKSSGWMIAIADHHPSSSNGRVQDG
jgi:hypothetical protein